MNNEARNDLKERTFEFAVRIVKLCRVLDKKAGVPRTLANQLLRSGTSSAPRSSLIPAIRKRESIFFWCP